MASVALRIGLQATILATAMPRVSGDDLVLLTLDQVAQETGKSLWSVRQAVRRKELRASMPLE
jgi:hypothetical protein